MAGRRGTVVCIAQGKAETAQGKAEDAQGKAEDAAEIAQGAIYEWFTAAVDTSTGHLIITETERGGA